MSEEEQFVNIDLNDDNICSVCKLETDTETLSFCHVCFELSIEGVSSSTLLHSKSLRGHRDCFEKYHLIANQKLSRNKAQRSAYQGVKTALSQKISRIVQYAQNREAGSEPGRRGGRHQLLCCSQQGDRTLVPQSDSRVPRYAPRWAEAAGVAAGLPDRGRAAEELALGGGVLGAGGCGLWAGGKRALHQSQKQGVASAGHRQHRRPGLSREELAGMSAEELGQLKGQLLLQIQKVFEELTSAVQDKDSLASELHVRHIAIEQLFKNCGKLPWLQIGRAGVKASNTPVE
ncbi:protein EURL homolog [Anguilla anguilla]|uniref:protein EURL homolog n=1 Tax=Anguilla anguilla TaxID=7936 RepID=UPI0015AC6660|nr:protein EURL homolog [Anguilla anguilla]